MKLNIRSDFQSKNLKVAIKFLIMAFWIILKIFLAASMYDKSNLTFIYAGF